MVTPEDYTGSTEFVHAHSHTIFSSLDGVATADQYADTCYDRGYPAMAVTEHGHMASVPDMFFAFRERGLKFIPACELYYNDYEPLRRKLVQSIKLKEIKEKDEILHSRLARNRHLTVLVKNETGFHNLIKLTTLAWEFGFYYLPRIWFDKLCEYKEGLIVLSGCLNGPVAYEIRLDCEHGPGLKRRPGIDHTAVEYVKKFHKAFGDDYYIELQMPMLPEIYDYQVFWRLVEIADEFGIKTVLVNDVHYLNRKDFFIQKVMMAVGQNTTIYDENMFHVNSDDQYMKTRAELWATFKNNKYSDQVSDAKFEEMCDNTLLIADICEGIHPDASPKIPDWSSVEPGKNADDELRRTVAIQLRKRGLDKITKKFLIDGREVTYVEQAKIELNRFIDKGFASYFLITQDLLQYGKKHGWPFGPRGSCGGSLVCYLLGIHNLDSMKWGLSFDRFMASSRGGHLLKVHM